MAEPLRASEASFPLSPAQQRLWLLSELEPPSPSLHAVTARRLRGALEAQALERALGEVVARQSMLRARLSIEDGEPALRLLAAVSVRLQQEDLHGVPRTEREEALARRVREEAWRAFELSTGPLLRAVLFRLEEEEHVLLLVVHQLAADAASLTVLMRELSVLYTRATARQRQVVNAEEYFAGRVSYAAMTLGEGGLPELPVTYAAYAAEQRGWVQGAEARAQGAYWKNQLAGVASLELPVDRPRPPVRNHRGARHAFELPAPLVERARTLAREQGTSLFVVLLAAFEAVLHRWSGQEDIAVGTRLEGRRRPEHKGLIGAFSNTLVLRAAVSGRMTFRELLRRLSEVTQGALAHQDLPFSTLVEELRPERDLSRTPLFQVMFSLEEAPTGLDFPGIQAEPLDVSLDAAPVDLTLRVVEGSGALRSALDYDTALFEPATIARMAGNLGTLLEGALGDPERPLSALPLLEDESRQQLLVSWNDTRREYPRDACLHELIEAQVARTPDAVALTFEGQSLTYRQLDGRANRLARHLRELGVGPEVLVGLSLERSLEMVVGLLAILKAGGAYVPLDPSYPRQRLAHMLEDARPAVLLTQRKLLEALPATGARTVCIDAPETPTGEETTGPDARAQATHLAYVLYTSGSTGKPSGVQVPHRALVNFMCAMRERPGISARDVLLALTTLSFDIAGLELYLPLTVGARVVIALREVATDGSRLQALMKAEGITLMQATPATWRMLLEAGWTQGAGLKALCGGEALTADLARRLCDTGVELWNMYGPTETTIWSTTGRVQGHGPISIGRPIGNTTVYVLDENLAPVPVGVRGMLYIGGDGVARGYLHRPEATAAKFVKDPFVGTPDARMYRTGDEARFLPDGSLEYLGRSDFQVKVRGFRIELGDVEAALAQHPQVRQAVVVAREDVPGDKRLVAYLVARSPEAPAWSTLRDFLRERLPEFMVPSACVVLEALPLTPAGKVDRRGLPAPERARPRLAEEHVAPRTPLEQALASVWAEVLGLERVGIRDDFFALGGESILAMRVVSRAGRAGLHFTPRQLMQHPTIERLVEHVTSAKQETDRPAPPRDRGEGEAILHPIQRWWFDLELEDPHHWNCAMMLEVPEDVDAAALEQACREVIAHHEALRFLYRRGPEGRWVQVCRPTFEEAFWSVVDLTGLSDEQRGMQLFSEANRLNASLDFITGPILRATLFRMAPGQPHRFHLCFHHLIMDDLSQFIVLEDLQTAYGQLTRGEPVRLPPTVSLKTWNERLYQHAQSARVRAEADYWRRSARAPFHALPVDFPSGEAKNYTARFAPIPVSPEETRALLQELPRKLGATIDEVLITALVLALEELTRKRSLHMNLMHHGRDVGIADVDASRTVGYLVSRTPTRIDVEGTTTALEALRAVQAQLRQVPGKGAGWGLLRYLSEDRELRRELAAAPTPEVTLTYLGQRDNLLLDAPLFRMAKEFQGIEYSPNGRRFEQVVFIGLVTGGQLQLLLLYCETIFRKETVERVVGALHTVLRDLIAEGADRPA